jgi:hypothetical protein
MIDDESNPKQRKRAIRSLDSSTTRPILVSNKFESAQKPGRPRIIADESDSQMYADRTVAKALKRFTDRCHFWAPGKSPKQIAKKVAKLCQSSKGFMTNTDIGAFDGSVNTLTWEFLERVSECFIPEHRERVKEVFKRITTTDTRTRTGKPIHLAKSLRSGSGLTSFIGTFMNALMCFVALYLILGDERKAWKALGMYSGDDGITADVEPEHFNATLAAFGFVGEAAKVERGTQGVTFLARQYGPTVFEGDSTSCCDLKRTMSRFLVTPIRDVSNAQILAEKARSAAGMDLNTPVFGAYLSKALELTRDQVDRPDLNLRHYNAFRPPEEQYPNAQMDWMWDYAYSSLDVSPSRVDAWLAKVQAAATVEEFLALEPLVAVERQRDFHVVTRPRRRDRKP